MYFIFQLEVRTLQFGYNNMALFTITNNSSTAYVRYFLGTENNFFLVTEDNQKIEIE